jgi:hypothetical protein
MDGAGNVGFRIIPQSYNILHNQGTNKFHAFFHEVCKFDPLNPSDTDM